MKGNGRNLAWIIPATSFCVNTRDDTEIMKMTNNRSFHENFETKQLPLPPDRSTGLVFAGISLLIAVLFRHNFAIAMSALAISGTFTLLAVFWPDTLRPLNIAWMGFAGLLDRFVNPLIMGLIFWLLIVPAGLIMQRLRDPLARKRPQTSSYWVPRTADKGAPTSMKNQF